MPTLWCLLPDKQMNTYVRLFRQLKRQAQRIQSQLNPIHIHIDFEMAVVLAVRAEFGIEPSGCLFHFSQSILRHMAADGLLASYNTNNPREVRTTVRRLMSLALVPPLRVDQAYQSICNTAPNVFGMNTLINYVGRTYVDNQTALFNRDIWSCYDRTDRTTNSCEAYHRVLNDRFRHRHPDPFKFVAFLQEQEMEIERRHAQLQLGAQPNKRRPVYLMVEETLARLRVNYFGGGIPNLARLVTYMDAVAHQLYDVKH